MEMREEGMSDLHARRRTGSMNKAEGEPLTPRSAALEADGVDQAGKFKLAAVLAGFLCLVFVAFGGSGYGTSLMWSDVRPRDEVSMASWNMAAINNNPFEYWLSLDNEQYEHLMDSVQGFITSPGQRDIRVKEVFTPAMFDELVSEMRDAFHDESSIKAVIKLYKNDFGNRRIVADFMTDGTLGGKRLASMPDRVTNTIPLKDGTFSYRPTVINCFPGSLNSVADWWPKWRDFMFHDEIDTVKVGLTRPASMLGKIPRAKYPLLSAQEEKISIPLQTLTAAIFDSTLVHMMSTISASENLEWQDLRRDICHAMNLRKNDRILEILKQTYSGRDVISLQEVAGAFVELAAADKDITDEFHVVGPQKRSRSDQNSVILLSKSRFPGGITTDITSQLQYSDPKAIADGDITLVRATDSYGAKFVVGSFHGDTNGLASIPLVTAVTEVVQPNELLLLGLDANTYEHGTKGKKQDVTDFARAFTSLGLDSCWGQSPDPTEYTTFNARTYLQPQLNKASSKSEIRQKGDVNPKDFILFKTNTFNTLRVQKDNTGKLEYIENHVFPTLEFPSDHGILSAIFKMNGEPKRLR